MLQSLSESELGPKMAEFCKEGKKIEQADSFDFSKFFRSLTQQELENEVSVRGFPMHFQQQIADTFAADRAASRADASAAAGSTVAAERGDHSATVAAASARNPGANGNGAVASLLGKLKEQCVAETAGAQWPAQWRNLPDMPAQRSGFQACLLHDGRVMIAGGDDRHAAGADTSLNQVACLRPAPLATLGGALVEAPRQQLASGTVSASSAPGSYFGVARTAEGGASAPTNLWEDLRPMLIPRSEFAMGVLPDGRVIVAGGCDGNNQPAMNSAECYDPRMQRWHSIPQMRGKRVACAGVVDCDGCFVVCGGEDDGDGQSPLATVEAYDPKKNVWSARPSMRYPRADHAIVAVGRDLLVIGSGRPAQATQDQNPLVVVATTAADWVAPAELYDGCDREQLP